MSSIFLFILFSSALICVAFTGDNAAAAVAGGEDPWFKYYKPPSSADARDQKGWFKVAFTGDNAAAGVAGGPSFKYYQKGFTGYQANEGDDSFQSYANTSTSTNSLGASSMKTNVSGSLVGIFFREKMLKQGTVMPMPDIRDKLPKRSFLPRSIWSKIPFTSSKISELNRIFKVSDNSSMEKVMMDSLSECERAPNMGETKRCVGSLEDMIDFATSILHRNVAVRTTENVFGSNNNVILGKVKGINGEKVTESVSCHKSLFPVLLYYCHSVRNVRLYEVDLLDPNSKAKINHGVAICHIDTTSWSPTHYAFLALGSGPGRIEVCHWIFENDMTWTTAD